MNVVRAVADTFRRDHLGACGNDYIKTPALDGLAARGDAVAESAYSHGASPESAKSSPATGFQTAG